MKPTVCLNMIIGDDSLEVINRNINSIHNFIDTYCICYNGNQPTTAISFIKTLLQNKTGAIYNRPWVNDFAFSRNEALELGKQHGDYQFFIDADNILKEENLESFEINPEVDAYYFNIETEDGTTFPRLCLVKSNREWYYKYTLHEKLFCQTKNPVMAENSNLTILAINDGVRSQNPNKRLNDLKILHKGFEETKDAHYAFYLAQTYRNLKDYVKALQYYNRCYGLSEDLEQEWYCKLQMTRMKEELYWPDELIVSDYIKAHTLNQNRAESLGYLAQFWEKKKLWWAMAWATNEAIGIPMPENALFVEKVWYNYLLLDKFATASINNQRFDDAIDSCEALLKSDKTPESEKPRIRENLERVMNARS